MSRRAEPTPRRRNDTPHHCSSRHLSPANQEKFQRLLAARGLAGTAIALGSSVTMVEKLDGGGGATSAAIVRVATALAEMA